MGKVIVVASGKGGTGKTTAVGAISSCLGALGHKTLCIDCDMGLRNLDITLGMSDFTVSDLSHVLSGTAALDEVAAPHPEIENLWFLSAPAVPFSGEGEDMKILTDEAREKFDFCILDAPAGLGSGFALAAAGADMAIIVTTGDLSSLRDGQAAADKLRQLGLSDIRLLVNRVRPRALRRMETTIDDMIDSVGAQLIGVVREDRHVGDSANREIPLVLFSQKGACTDFLQTARRISGESLPIKF